MEIWKERNTQVHSKVEGKSFTDQYIQQWVTAYYENKDTLVTEDERKKLFDVPLNGTLANRPQSAKTFSVSVFNRVRPPEHDISLHNSEEDFTPIDIE
jgi:hypothetical protein